MVKNGNYFDSLLTFIISTRCGTLSAQATCRGPPMIELCLFISAPASSKHLANEKQQ